MLVLGSQRAVYKAIDAFNDGSFRIQLDGELAFETDTGRYRIIDGICFMAQDSGLEGDASRMIGADLVGWLHESIRASGVGGFWRRGARAVFVTKEGAPLVTPATHHLDVDGAAAKEGIWTHDRRLLVGHGERPVPVTMGGGPPYPPAQPVTMRPPAQPVPQGKRPSSVSPPNAWALAPPVVGEQRSEPLPSFADELFGGPPRRGRPPSWS